MIDTKLKTLNKLAKVLIVKKFPNYFSDIIFTPENVYIPELGALYITFVITEEFLDIVYNFSRNVDERTKSETKEEFYVDQYKFTSESMDYLREFENFKLSKVLMDILGYVDLREKNLWVKEIIVDYGSKRDIS